MSKYKDSIQKQFKNLKTTMSELVSSKDKQNKRSYIELDPAAHKKLQQIADERNTTVEAVYSQAIENFIASQTNKTKSLVTLEQKEKNPLLYLENLSNL